MDGGPGPIEKWIVDAGIIHELIYGPLPDADIVGTQGRHLVPLPSSPIHHVPVDFTETLRMKLQGALYAQKLRVRRYGPTVAEEWPNHLTPPGIRRRYYESKEEQATRALAMSSSSEDSSDDRSESPQQRPRATPPSSEEGIVVPGGLIEETPAPFKPLHFDHFGDKLRGQLRRAGGGQRETSTGTGRGPKENAAVENGTKSYGVRLARKRQFSKIDGDVAAANDRIVKEPRRSTRVKPMDRQYLHVSTMAPAKRVSKARGKSARIDRSIIQEAQGPARLRRSARLQAKAVGPCCESALPQAQSNERKRRKSAMQSGSRNHPY